ncbi:hypothetical protein HOY34_09015 [Xinfangfangia sp. D13-10-4-6]|uniref:hypothetical protein n=1 Tax=Pseudogemmobacter hezensis TaxID=2737662 RepID=UPI001554B2FA|nr:hypothetical protein [Pseudogemmobacter hezensis]NPD15338.1 hypothetical protein [Pseudogemmobacter hezensis]
MKLMLRAADRIDGHVRPPKGRNWAAAPDAVLHDDMGGGATPGMAAQTGVLPRPWRVPGFQRPERLGRADWLMRGFSLLASDGHQALTLATLCDCAGGSRAGFLGLFGEVADFRAEMIALWESTGLQAEVGPHPGQTVLSCFLGLAAETAAPQPLPAGGEDQPGSVVVERAIRVWAQADALVARALARVECHRVAQLRGLLVSAGLSAPRAQERAEVFYAARVGFDALQASMGITGEGAMRALAIAILGGKISV